MDYENIVYDWLSGLFLRRNTAMIIWGIRIQKSNASHAMASI